MGGPVYDPARVKELAISEATRAITLAAEDGCYQLGLTLEDVWTALAELDGPNCRFYKSMPSDKRPDDLFDVYELFMGPHAIYLKFKVTTRPRGFALVVVSFKRNEHYD
jgi:hypothetical protein